MPTYLERESLVFDMKRIFRDDSGFTIAEYVMATAILLIVSIAIMGTLAYAATANSSTAQREGALELANQRLEMARNLPYADIGTVGGWPAGDLLTEEVVGDYTVNIEVLFATNPDVAETAVTSKAVRVTVSWEGARGGHVTVASNINGKPDTGNTCLVEVTVVDADTNLKMPGARITIASLSGKTATLVTNTQGVARFAGWPSGKSTITGTATGYVLDVASFADLDLAADTKYQFTINAIKTSTATITVVDAANSSTVIPGASVTMNGVTKTSDSAGKAVFEGLFPGDYTVTATKANYSPVPIIVSTGTGGGAVSGTLTMKGNPKLTITVRDDGGLAVQGASLSFSPGLPGATTGADGVAVIDVPAANSGYAITAGKSGYTSKTVSVGTISADTSILITIPKAALQPGTLTVKFYFLKKDTTVYSIRIVNVDDASTLVVPVFTMKTTNSSKNRTVTYSPSFTLPAGDYLISGKSTFPPIASTAMPVTVPSGGSVSVTLTKSN